MGLPSFKIKKYGVLRSKQETVTIYAMLAPTLIFFGLLSIYPIIYIFQMSFFEYNGMGPMKWVGLYNYARVMRDETFWKTVITTVQFGIIIPLVQIPLSLMFAVILNGNIKGRGFFRAFLFLPNITSTAIMGIIFYFMFATFNGIVNGVLTSLGLISTNIEWLGNTNRAKFVILLFNNWANVGFYMVLFLSALQKIPKDVYESAAMDGANTGTVFFKITIPMLGNMFKIITMLCILGALRLFDSVKVLTGGGPGGSTEVISMYIYRYYFEPSGGVAQQGYASAVAIVGALIITAITLIYGLATKNISDN